LLVSDGFHFKKHGLVFVSIVQKRLHFLYQFQFSTKHQKVDSFLNDKWNQYTGSICNLLELYNCISDHYCHKSVHISPVFSALLYQSSAEPSVESVDLYNECV